MTAPAHPGPQLSAWLDGELPGAEAAALAVHVEACPACAAELAEVDAARSAVRSLLALEAPPGVLRATPAVHVGDLISALLDGEIDADLAPGLEAHLAACPACAAERDEVGWARTAVRALPPVDPPKEVLQPGAGWSPPPPRPRPPVAPVRTRQIAAAAVALAAAGVGVFGLVGRSAPADTTRPAVASFVSQHSTSQPGPDAVSGLAPAAVPVSFTR